LRRLLEATALVTRAIIHPYSDNKTFVKKRSIPGFFPGFYTHLPAISPPLCIGQHPPNCSDIGGVNKSRLAQVSLPLCCFLRQDVTCERFSAAELPAAGSFETLGCAAIAFHLRHCNSRLVSVLQSNQKPYLQV
jgi:hypothetical protein